MLQKSVIKSGAKLWNAYIQERFNLTTAWALSYEQCIIYIKWSLVKHRGNANAGEVAVFTPTCKCRYIPQSLKCSPGGTTTAGSSVGHAPRPDGPHPLSRWPWRWCTLPSAGRGFVLEALSWTLGRRGLLPHLPLWITPTLETPGSSHLETNVKNIYIHISFYFSAYIVYNI